MIRNRPSAPSRRMLVCLVALLAASCRSNTTGSEPAEPSQAGAGAEPTQEKTMKLTSSAFEHEQSIPAKYTCEGEDVSPPLSWSDIPEGTKSLALIIDDPDAPDPAAPKRVWVHWVVFNLSPDTTQLAEASATSLPTGAKTGKNDWDKAAYGGPCPPIGRHRYFHKIYALDTTLDLEAPTKAELEQAMQGHILGQGELIGTYQKQG